MHADVERAETAAAFSGGVRRVLQPAVRRPADKRPNRVAGNCVTDLADGVPDDRSTYGVFVRLWRDPGGHVKENEAEGRERRVF